jgi:alpha-1,2-mannosyltransferase
MQDHLIADEQPSTLTAPRPVETSFDDVYRKLSIAAAVFFVIEAIAIAAFSGWPPAQGPWFDPQHYLLGRDFINFWMGGRAFTSGGPAPWFDAYAYNDVLREMLGGQYPPTFWSYPPHIELFIWPLGLLPYNAAYVVWCAIGIALFLFACSSAVDRGKLWLLALTPAAGICIFFGQNGFYTAALLAGGLLNRERRPVLTGILFGILTIKPHLGLLLPVLLLLERRWLVIAAATATAALLVIVTSLLFGWHIWVEYWQKVMPQQVGLMIGSQVLGWHVSTLSGARLMGLPLNIAWIVQYIVSMFAFAAVVWTFWRRRDPLLSMALFITATFLFAPYTLFYDLVIFGLVVATLRERADNTTYDHALLIAIWSLPLTMGAAAIFGVPLAPIVLIAFVISLLCRLRASVHYDSWSRSTLSLAPPHHSAVHTM